MIYFIAIGWQCKANNDHWLIRVNYRKERKPHLTTFKKYKACTVTGEYFNSFFELSQTSILELDRNTEKMKILRRKKENHLFTFIIKMYILFSRAFSYVNCSS